MDRRITIRKSDGLWVARAGGAVLAESREALELSETGHSPVIYFPRDDVAMAFFERTDKITHCPWKGAASHYSIHTKSTILENVAWSYESPIADAERIAGHLAFYPDKVTVEQL
jgi:uncharacterized protein (DUF427 family)